MEDKGTGVQDNRAKLEEMWTNTEGISFSGLILRTYTLEEHPVLIPDERQANHPILLGLGQDTGPILTGKRIDFYTKLPPSRVVQVQPVAMRFSW